MIEQTALEAIAEACRLERELDFAVAALTGALNKLFTQGQMLAWQDGIIQGQAMREAEQREQFSELQQLLQLERDESRRYLRGQMS